MNPYGETNQTNQHRFLFAVLFVWLHQSDYAFLRGWQANGDETEAIPVYNGEYRLIFDENFDESPLDPAIWNDQYLASWTPDMESARAVYEVADGNLNLIIHEGYPAVESRI